MAYARKRARRKAPARRRPAARRSYRRPTARRRVTRKRKGRVPISKFVLAQLDPFSEKVDGVKVPDMNTVPSFTAKVEDEYPITSGATYGTNVRAFTPFTAGSSITAASITDASTWVWTGGTIISSSKQTYMSSNAELYRPVSHGIRLLCALAPNNVTGYVHICTVPLSYVNAAVYDYLPTTVAQMQASPNYKRLPLAMLTQRPIKVTNKVVDENGYRYIGPAMVPYGALTSSYSVSIQNAGWCAIVVAVTGVPLSTTAISAECIAHVECLPTLDGSQNVTPAENYNPTELSIGSRVNTQAPAVSSGESSVLDNLYEGARSRVNEAYNEVYSTVSGALYDRAYGVGQGLVDTAFNAAMGYYRGGVNRAIVPY